jgi:hypothetical protein
LHKSNAGRSAAPQRFLAHVGSVPGPSRLLLGATRPGANSRSAWPIVAPLLPVGAHD